MSSWPLYQPCQAAAGNAKQAVPAELRLGIDEEERDHHFGLPIWIGLELIASKRFKVTTSHADDLSETTPSGLDRIPLAAS